jgi:hypothetical protein
MFELKWSVDIRIAMQCQVEMEMKHGSFFELVAKKTAIWK